MEQGKIIKLDETNVCKICRNAISKYICPKCNIVYCSLNCYQSQTHLKCSEEFYCESVMTELCPGDEDEAAKQKMIEILAKVRPKLPIPYTNEELDSDDGEPIPPLDERLENVDLDDANKVWEHLTTDEKQEFDALINSGDVTSIMPVWTPWWEKVEKKKMVEEVATSTQYNYKKICPEVMENIKPLEHISTLKPAECVKYNIVNVIVAYACTVRYFNGFHFDFANEAVYVLSKLSLNLLSNTNFESYSVALESVYQETLVNDWMSAKAKDTIGKDAENILVGPECEKNFFIKSALSDIYKLLSHAKELLSKTDNTLSEFYKKYIETGLPKEKIVSKTKFIFYSRKIEYYLSYVCSFVFDV